AERLLRAETILSPRAGWVHLQLGEIYFRRLWRRDAEKEWESAVALDPTLRRDQRLHAHLCAILAPSWKGAGERFIVSHLGADAAQAMLECIRSADDAERLRAAVRVLERTGQRSRIDRALVSARLGQLTRLR